MTAGGPVIAYQDATWHELLLARQDDQGLWQHTTIAGDEDPFAGGYGFYISSEFSGQDVVMSTWVVDQSTGDAWICSVSSVTTASRNASTSPYRFRCMA